jgi:hypothetical protein
MTTIVALLFLLLPVNVSAQSSYHVYVITDKSSYYSGQTIGISGGVHPLGSTAGPGPDTAVFLRIFNPNGTLVAIGDAPVNATTGAFMYSVVAGGTPSWLSGMYTVNATWGAYPPAVYGTTTFAFTVLVNSTTTSMTTLTTTTTTTSMTTTTASSTTSHHSPSTSTLTSSASTTTSSSTISVTTTVSSSSTASATSSVPEFPYAIFAIIALTTIIVASYLVMRRHPPASSPRTPVRFVFGCCTTEDLQEVS